MHWWVQRASWPTPGPVAFTEKLEWKRLKDRRELLTVFADKAAAREYVSQVIGPELLIRCHALVDDPGDIRLDDLPREFVLKPTHSSGPVYIVADPPLDEPRRRHVHLPKSGVIFCDPDALDWNEMLLSSRRWLTKNYGEKHVEWAYRHVQPRLMVEELLRHPDGHLPDNFRFYVFHGCARLVQVDRLRRDGWQRRHYLPDWTPIDVQIKFPTSPDAIPRPQHLAEMLEVADRLGQETDFVRVDLYDVEGRIAFGELTNYPGGDRAEIPRWFDVELGQWWHPPTRYAP